MSSIRFHDADGKLLLGLSGSDVTLDVPAGAATVSVADDSKADAFVLAHLDEIIAIAASAVRQRNSMKAPAMDNAARARQFRTFTEHSTVVDTIPDDLRGWLLARTPHVETRFREGG